MPWGVFLSPAMTKHQSGSDAICLTVVVGAKMVVVTAQFLHREPRGAGEGAEVGFHWANRRDPGYARTLTALKSVPLDDSEMPLLAHEAAAPPSALPPLQLLYA